ncbi:condensation domain-containing protein [Streptomyces bottropensis]|uniref:Condensation domain-containing protein n=1 Tax=Streptomyces bottropensis TaxID=42235 RepID=A0ABU8B188_9ACTN
MKRSAKFSGCQERYGALTLAQVQVLLCTAEEDPAEINLHTVLELPPGVSVEGVTRTLGVLMERHESLRTAYFVAPEPYQHVRGTGEVPVAVHAAEGDPAACAHALGARLRAVRFDPAVDWPLRAAVITADEMPAYLVLAVSHVAFDAAALALVQREWLSLLAGQELPEAAEVHPVDLAVIEASPRGRRRSADSLRYWESQLRSGPQAMLTLPAAPSSATSPSAPTSVRRLRIRSHSAAEALGVLAERTGTSRSKIVLTALCALTAHLAGQRRAVAVTISGNRRLPEVRNYVGTVAQDALLSVDTSGTTFDGLVNRVRESAELAYANSWFDAGELRKMLWRIGCERGTSFARDCVFNDISPLGLDDWKRAGQEDPRDPAQEIQLDWLPAEPYTRGLELWAFRMKDELDLALSADPSQLRSEDTELFGRGIAALLIEAARHDLPLGEIPAITGLPAVVRSPRWLMSDGCWINLDDMHELVATALASLAEPSRPVFQVIPEPDDRLEHRLVCYLTGVSAAWSTAELTQLHSACVHALHGRRSAMAPHHYVVCDGAPANPANPADTAAWREQPVLLTTTGRG